MYSKRPNIVLQFSSPFVELLDGLNISLGGLVQNVWSVTGSTLEVHASKAYPVFICMRLLTTDRFTGKAFNLAGVHGVLYSLGKKIDRIPSTSCRV